MIFKFRMISNEDEDFFRDFEVKYSSSFLDFHKAIQKELDYDETQMASFFLSNKEWEKGDEITLMDMGFGNNPKTMENTILQDEIKGCKERLLYVFDLLSERAFFLECTACIEEIKGKEYPCCEQSAGNPPKQMLFDNFNEGLNPEIDSSFEDELKDLDDGIQFENLDDFEDL